MLHSIFIKTVVKRFVAGKLWETKTPRKGVFESRVKYNLSSA